MNWSIYTADRTTHLKIVVVGLGPEGGFLGPVVFFTRCSHFVAAVV